MRFAVMILITFLVLSGCSRPQVTIEERVLMKGFISTVAGEVYDRICNGGKITQVDDVKKMNVNLFGNNQLFAARLGNLIHIREPNLSVENGVKRLLKAKEKAEIHTQKILEEEGCSSEKAKNIHSALTLYTQYHPAIINGLIDKQIEKEGGTITPPSKD